MKSNTLIKKPSKPEELEIFSPKTNLNYFYQTSEGNCHWSEVSETTLQKLLKRDSVALHTVLGFAGSYDEKNAEDTRYFGNFYIDIDVAPEQGGISTAIIQVNLLLDKFEGIGINLNSLAVFASGSKGFHIEVPPETFGLKEPLEQLPAIYREMVMVYFVDGIDLRVYTAKRGRMWRVPNHLRSNGNYKVPISIAETRCMTPGRYEALVSCICQAPYLAAPEFNVALASSFVKAHSKVNSAIKNRNVVSKASSEMYRRFGNKFPPSISLLAEGKVQSPKGFNQIAVQLAILAHSLGMDESAFINSCKGLIRNHKSDGRYSTPQARGNELSEKWYYMQSNNYSLSIGALKSLLPKGVSSRDLAGL